VGEGDRGPREEGADGGEGVGILGSCIVDPELEVVVGVNGCRECECGGRHGVGHGGRRGSGGRDGVDGVE